MAAGLEVHTSTPQHTSHGMLQELPDHLLLSVCAHYGLGGRDLAHLE
eukprot:COSAG01_NODE_55083_length_327_cov_1.271930_1_plen_46_part_10